MDTPAALRSRFFLLKTAPFAKFFSPKNALFAKFSQMQAGSEQEKAAIYKNLQKKLDIQKFLTILSAARAGITQW